MMGSFGGGQETDLDAVPAFEISEPPLGRVITANTWAFGSLFLYLIIPFLVAYVRFLRYDVR